MVQWSVYSRLCNGADSIEMHKQRLKQNLPQKGAVRCLILSEKQYSSIDILLGTSTFHDMDESTDLINIFWKKNGLRIKNHKCDLFFCMKNPREYK